MRGATIGVARARAAVLRAPVEARDAVRKTDLNIVYEYVGSLSTRLVNLEKGRCKIKCEWC